MADEEDATDEEVVRTPAEAAEGVVLDCYKQSRIDDLDLTVTFEDGVLEIDLYVDPPDDADADPEAVVDAAVEAAEEAVDDLLAAAED